MRACFVGGCPAQTPTTPLHAQGRRLPCTGRQLGGGERVSGMASRVAAGGSVEPGPGANGGPRLDVENREDASDAAPRELEAPAGARMLVLVGVPGSGKSTFASRLERCHWVRVCQDVLGSRKACESVTRRCLREGRNVVIDRCNFDSKQRATWIGMAREMGCPVGAAVFATPLDECMSRVQMRETHETLEPGPEAAQVVRRMASAFRPPNQSEKLQFCRYLRTVDDTERFLIELGVREDAAPPGI